MTSFHIPPVRVVMRNYFSTQLLWSSDHQGRMGARIESLHDGESTFNMEHRAYVLVAIQAAVAFLEAMINELFQDAADGHGRKGDGYLAPLDPETILKMATYWTETEGRRYVLTKYNKLLEFAGYEAIAKDSDIYQDAESLVLLRNAITHYRSEDVAADVEHDLTSRLQGRFPSNVLMTGSGNPWWPDHCLGSGCAVWSRALVKDFADNVVDRVGVRPNYRRHEEQKSFPQVLGLPDQR